MKVGDLVKWENVLNDSMDHHREDHGIVVKMSRTGHDSRIGTDIVHRWGALVGGHSEVDGGK